MDFIMHRKGDKIQININIPPSFMQNISENLVMKNYTLQLQQASPQCRKISSQLYKAIPK